MISVISKFPHTDIQSQLFAVPRLWSAISMESKSPMIFYEKWNSGFPVAYNSNAFYVFRWGVQEWRIHNVSWFLFLESIGSHNVANGTEFPHFCPMRKYLKSLVFTMFSSMHDSQGSYQNFTRGFTRVFTRGRSSPGFFQGFYQGFYQGASVYQGFTRVFTTGISRKTPRHGFTRVFTRGNHSFCNHQDFTRVFTRGHWTYQGFYQG